MTAPQQRPNPNDRALQLYEARKAEVEDKLAGVRADLLATLGPTIDRDRWLTIAADAVLSNPKILECEPLSIIVALRTAARYGLEPVGELGEGCLVPYKENNVLRLQFQPMYRGLMHLARNSGGVGQMDAQIVFANDVFEWQLGTDSFIKHVPAWIRGDRVGAYSWARILADSSLQIEPMPLTEIERVRAVSKQFRYAEKDGTNDSLWHKWPDEMAKKTAFRRLMKKLPLSAQARDLLAYDDRSDVIDGQATDVSPTRMVISGNAAAALERVRGNRPSKPEAKVEEKTDPNVCRAEASNGVRCELDSGHVFADGSPSPHKSGEQTWPNRGPVNDLSAETPSCGWRLGQGSGKSPLPCTKPKGHDGKHSWDDVAVQTGGRVIPPESEW